MVIKGLGHAIVGNFSIVQVVIELTERIQNNGSKLYKNLNKTHES